MLKWNLFLNGTFHYEHKLLGIRFHLKFFSLAVKNIGGQGKSNFDKIKECSHVENSYFPAQITQQLKFLIKYTILSFTVTTLFPTNKVFGLSSC